MAFAAGQCKRAHGSHSTGAWQRTLRGTSSAASMVSLHGSDSSSGPSSPCHISHRASPTSSAPSLPRPGPRSPEREGDSHRAETAAVHLRHALKEPLDKTAPAGLEGKAALIRWHEQQVAELSQLIKNAACELPPQSPVIWAGRQRLEQMRGLPLGLFFLGASRDAVQKASASISGRCSSEAERIRKQNLMKYGRTERNTVDRNASCHRNNEKAVRSSIGGRKAMDWLPQSEHEHRQQNTNMEVAHEQHEHDVPLSDRTRMSGRSPEQQEFEDHDLEHQTAEPSQTQEEECSNAHGGAFADRALQAEVEVKSGHSSQAASRRESISSHGLQSDKGSTGPVLHLDEDQSFHILPPVDVPAREHKTPSRRSSQASSQQRSFPVDVPAQEKKTPSRRSSQVSSQQRSLQEAQDTEGDAAISDLGYQGQRAASRRSSSSSQLEKSTADLPEAKKYELASFQAHARRDSFPEQSNPPSSDNFELPDEECSGQSNMVSGRRGFSSRSDPPLLSKSGDVEEATGSNPFLRRQSKPGSQSQRRESGSAEVFSRRQSLQTHSETSASEKSGARTKTNGSIKAVPRYSRQSEESAHLKEESLDQNSSSLSDRAFRQGAAHDDANPRDESTSNMFSTALSESSDVQIEDGASVKGLRKQQLEDDANFIRLKA